MKIRILFRVAQLVNVEFRFEPRQVWLKCILNYHVHSTLEITQDPLINIVISSYPIFQR